MTIEIRNRRPGQDVSISFQIPRLLQRYCGQRSELAIQAEHVAEALLIIREKFPDLYVSLCDETGKVRQHINLFINDRLVKKTALHLVKLQPGDNLLVFTAVSGG